MGVRRITLQEYEKADQIKRVAFLRTTRGKRPKTKRIGRKKFSSLFGRILMMTSV